MRNQKVRNSWVIAANSRFVKLGVSQRAHATPPWVTATLRIISAAGWQNAENTEGMQRSGGIKTCRRNLPTVPDV